METSVIGNVTQESQPNREAMLGHSDFLDGACQQQVDSNLVAQRPDLTKFFGP